MDAGTATEDNLAALRKRGYHWSLLQNSGQLFSRHSPLIPTS